MDTHIKLITKDTDISTLKMSKMPWDVCVQGVPYQVVDIEGYVHSCTLHSENTYWMYPRYETPCYDNLIQYDCKGNGVLWDFVYNKTNVHKSKYDEDFVHTICKVTIRRNGEQFCTTHSIQDALHKIEIMDEHPLDLYCIDFDRKCIGRKIYYHGQPCVIKRFINGLANVVINPEEGYTFVYPPEWEDCEPEDDDFVTSIFDGHIYWYRD